MIDEKTYKAEFKYLKFKRHIQCEPSFKQFDIVPVVNVFFLFAIFYMLSSVFVSQPGIIVKLPKIITSEVINKESLVILVTSENITYLNNLVVTLEELKDELSKPSYQKRPILIKADRRASLGRIIDIWDLCRGLNIENVNMATDHKQ